MKKIILLLLIIYGSLNAQDDATKIFAFSVEGKVLYNDASTGKFKKLNAGTELAPEDKVWVKKKGKVGIQYGTEYTYLDKLNVHIVKVLTSDVSAFEEDDISEIFGEYITKASDPYFKLIEVDDKFGFAGGPMDAPPKDERDGHGNKNFSVLRIQPVGGKIAGPTTKFEWKVRDNDLDANEFRLVLSSSTGETLLDKTVTGTSYTLSSTDPQLQPGKSYRWQVTSTDNSELFSTDDPFRVVSVAEQNSIIEELAEEYIYEEADESARLILEALIFEDEDFLAKALEKYQEAAEDQKNELAQLMYKAFLYFELDLE